MGFNLKIPHWTRMRKKKEDSVPIKRRVRQKTRVKLNSKTG